MYGVCALLRLSLSLSPLVSPRRCGESERASARAGIGREPVTDTRAAAESRYKSGAERRGSEKEEGEERRGAKA